MTDTNTSCSESYYSSAEIDSTDSEVDYCSTAEIATSYSEIERSSD